ncbi:hypothetical protein JYK14_06140, partial [Siccirubricoccus sp. KC 17139]
MNESRFLLAGAALALLAGCVQVQPAPYYGAPAPGSATAAGAITGAAAGGLLGGALSGRHD